MQNLSLPSIGFYCLFGIFVFYQQLQVKNFQGASQKLYTALNVSAFLGMLTGIVYLIYYGWTVVWWAPAVILFIGIICGSLGVIFERLVGSLALSLGAFVGWPASAFFMFKNIPHPT
jgi:hypothetical protein